MNCGPNPMDSPLICPKPRRILNPNKSHCNWLPLRNEADAFVSKGGAELFDLIHKEDDIFASHLSTSPPFFFGSPPCRAMNPLIHDAHFATEKQPRLSSSPSPSTSASSSPSSSYKGRCARARIGKSQSPNRIEGFDCQNSRMAAMA